MTRSASSPGGRRLGGRRARRWLQLRLRTLLLLTAAAALLLWWWQRPTAQTRRLGPGLVVEEHYREQPVAGADGRVPVLSGPAEVRSDAGRLMCRGHFHQNRPSGRWTYFHPNGRRQAEGFCEEGELTGRWRTWRPDGTAVAEVRFRRIAETEFGVADSPPAPPGEFARLDGGARGWHANGQLRWSGAFARGLRHGLWQQWDEAGRLISAGEYAAGVRVGEWKFGDGRRVAYRGGHAVDSPLDAVTDFSPHAAAARQLYVAAEATTDEMRPEALLELAENAPIDVALGAVELLAETRGEGRAAETLEPPPLRAESLARLQALTRHHDRDLAAGAALAWMAVEPAAFERAWRQLTRITADAAPVRDRVALALQSRYTKDRIAPLLRGSLASTKLAVAVLHAGGLPEAEELLQQAADDPEVSADGRRLLRLTLQRMPDG